MEKSKDANSVLRDKEGLAKIKKELEINGKKLSIELDKLAFQADGSVVVRLGDTVILATAVMSEEVREGIDYLPLLVDYEEKLYAAGKIKGSRWVKREGRPTDEAILTSRLIDRSIRPFFDEKIRNDIQIIPTVLSVDGENDPDIVSIIASSVALSISDIPFDGPIAAVRVGKIGKDFIINPSYKEREEGDLDLVIAGNGEKIVMLEGGAKEIREELIISALEFGLKYIEKIIELERDFQSLIKPKKLKEVVLEEEVESSVVEKVKKYVKDKLDKTLFVRMKRERTEKLKELKDEVSKQLAKESKLSIDDIGKVFDQIVGKRIREAILKEEKRVDGRSLDEIRPISIRVGLLPRTHGSALFSRGETQALTIVTLGSPGKAQLLDTMEVEGEKRFIHYYNFPPFCSGEVKPLRWPSRREIGHGALAERALAPVIPSEDEFPYTILIVSEILSSNGSTSMAATCGSSLALMDAGVPIKRPVAGISIGLIAKNDEDYKLLTDIAGFEDHDGDMDFKVAGTEKGVTILQMDVKVHGINLEIIRKALERGKRVREEILEKMEKVISTPRTNVSPYAPKILQVKIAQDKIGEVIGPGGKIINEIINETGADIDIKDDGRVFISSQDEKQVEKAKKWIQDLTREVKPGEIFQGKVTRITNFGAFVEILPGKEGLVHISQLSDRRIERVEDVVKIGDVIPVMVADIDQYGRINLSCERASGNHKINSRDKSFRERRKF